MTRFDPIIIIGMHRSGTTMVARLLQRVGLFIGWRRDPNFESLLFLELNEWLLRQVHAAWDDPGPVRKLRDDETVRAAAVRVLGRTLGSWPRLGYLGPLRAATCRTLAGQRSPWGWKDPRNTLTFPLWLDLFPDARVLHVTRHGVDVANSLVVRERRASPVGSLSPFRLLGLLGAPRLAPSQHCGTVSEAFSLWEQYMTLAAENGRGPGAEILQIRYEDFLTSPQTHLAEVAAFAGLNPTARAVERACSGLKPDRAFAHRGDPELARLADSLSGRLEKFGY